MKVITSLCAWLLLLLSSPLLATSPKPLEKSLRWITAKELVAAALTGRSIRRCRVKGSDFIDAIEALLSSGFGTRVDPVQRAVKGAPGVSLSHCVIYPEYAATNGQITFPFRLTIRDSWFKRLDTVDSLAPSYSPAFFLEKFTFAEDVELTDNTFDVEVSFREAEFVRTADFSDSTFKRIVTFDDSQFKHEGLFRNTTFESHALFIDADLHTSVDFDGAAFSGVAVFRGTRFLAPMYFRNVTFRGEVQFDQAEIKSLEFFGIDFAKAVYFRHARALAEADSKLDEGVRFISTTFRAPVFFNGAQMGLLSFAGPPELRNAMLPTVFERDVSFRDMKCRICELTDTHFRGRTGFESADITKLDLSRSSFSGPVFVSKLVLPSDVSECYDGDARGLFLDGTIFERGIVGRSRNLGAAVASTEAETWENISELLKRSNHDGELRATYCARLLSGASERSGWKLAVDRASYYFWGYQTRPQLVVIWMLVWWLAFSALYYGQTGPLRIARIRAMYAMRFSVERCIKFDLTGSAATTPLFKAITVVESVGAKVILLLFFKSISSRFPMLDGIIGKLVPF